MIWGQNFKFFLSWSMIKLDLEMLFGGDLERNQSDSEHI